MSLDIKQVNYKNFGKCVSISNSVIEVIVTIDIGPRIISFRLLSGSNVLYNDVDRLYTYKGKDLENYYGLGSVFFTYGGHRLWTIPKAWPQTYYPDNNPVVYSVVSDGVCFSPPAQTENEIALTLEIMMNENTSDIMVINSLQNISKNKQILALNGITQVCGGGVLVIPQNPPSENALLPNRSYAFWPYTKMNDERLYMGNKFITITQNKNIKDKLKLGTNNYSNSSSYFVDGFVFTKNYVHNKKARYPDFNSSFEAYADGNFLEISSISPLYNLQPDETVRHVENWSINHSDSKILPRNEVQIAEVLKSL